MRAFSTHAFETCDTSPKMPPPATATSTWPETWAVERVGAWGKGKEINSGGNGCDKYDPLKTKNSSQSEQDKNGVRTNRKTEDEQFGSESKSEKS